MLSRFALSVSLTQNHHFSTVNIELTVAGLARVEEVCEIVFQYVGMLQREGVSERVWREEQAVATMNFKFK